MRIPIIQAIIKRTLPPSFLLIAILLLVSCSTTAGISERNKIRSDFFRINLLQGTWKGYHNGQPFYESWKFVNDSLLANYEIIIGKNDTAIKEGSHFRIINNEIILGDPHKTFWKADSISSRYIRVRNDTLKSSKIIIWKHSDNDHWLTLNLNGTIRYDMTRLPSLDSAVKNKLPLIK